MALYNRNDEKVILDHLKSINHFLAPLRICLENEEGKVVPYYAETTIPRKYQGEMYRDFRMPREVGVHSVKLFVDSIGRLNISGNEQGGVALTLDIRTNPYFMLEGSRYMVNYPNPAFKLILGMNGEAPSYEVRVVHYNGQNKFGVSPFTSCGEEKDKDYLMTIMFEGKPMIIVNKGIILEAKNPTLFSVNPSEYTSKSFSDTNDLKTKLDTIISRLLFQSKHNTSHGPIMKGNANLPLRVAKEFLMSQIDDSIAYLERQGEFPKVAGFQFGKKYGGEYGW